MPTLHTYLIGINEYAGNIRNLQGCVRDIELLDQYFQKIAAQQSWQYRSLLLRNAEATRGRIITGFSHFDDVKDGDFCVWAYSGHGTRLPAPPVFWSREPDKQHEAIVCHDSGLPEGRYLLDKENAWLLWQATKDKNIHCLVLTDCCHAGTNLRLEHSNERYHRHTTHALPPQLSDYLGVEDYIIDGEYQPTTGRFVQFAACRADQVSFEQAYNDGYRGIFTYELLQTLHQNQAPLTYPELFQRLRQRMSSRVKNQTPQLDYSVPELKSQVFLSQQFLSGVTGAPKVYASQDHNAWLLNLGTLHGIQADASRQPEVWLPELEKGATLKKVHADYSELERIEMADPKMVYRAEVNSAGINVAFAPDFPLEKRAVITQALTKLPSPSYISWQTEAAKADYWIELLDQRWLRLTTKDGLRSCFKRVKLDQQELFLSQVSQVGKWEHLYQIQNTNSPLPDGALHFDFKTYAPAADFSAVPPTQIVELPSVAHLSYTSDQQDLMLFPAFSLAIANISGRPLFLSVILLANDYSISNSLLPNQKLDPGERVQLSHKWAGQEDQHIRLAVEDCLIQAGVDYAPERLKVIASLTELNTEDFNTVRGLCADRRSQKGLASEKAGRPNLPIVPAWCTYDLDIITEFHHSWKALPVIYHAHQLFSTDRSLLTQLLSIQAINNWAAQPFWWQDSQLAAQPKMRYEWTPGFNRAEGLCVLAIAPSNATDHPKGLSIQFPVDVKTEELKPCSLTSTGALSVLPHHWEGNILEIDSLPIELVYFDKIKKNVILLLFYYFSTAETGL